MDAGLSRKVLINVGDGGVFCRLVEGRVIVVLRIPTGEGA